MRMQGKDTFLLICIAVLVGLLAVLVFFAVGLPAPSEPTEPTIPSTSFPTTGITSQPTTEPTTAPTTEPTEPPVVKTATVTLGAVGDVLMHKPVINTGLQSDGSYNFEDIFQYFADYCSGVDYMVANLETTLAGLDNGYPYQGYPRFNSPDGIITTLQNVGFDMILTANNHSYDTGHTGLIRTQEVLQNHGLDWLGTKLNEQDKNYLVVNLEGISVGMVCYTYETDGDSVKKSLNGLPVKEEDRPLINSFDVAHLSLFYEEMRQNMEAMESEGVDVVIAFMHWGTENKLTPLGSQTMIAQQLCEMGVDVIIGGHPHVVQPMELLTSADGNHSTICLYSMGNFISNQRREEDGIPKSGHTEDGILFTVTMSRYSDGTVLVEAVEAIPFWVNKAKISGAVAYRILPLDIPQEQWKEAFSIDDATYARLEESLERTNALIAEGSAKVDAYLAEYVAQVEAAIGVG